MNEGSRRAIIAAFLANLGIAAAKFVAFAATGAASMLAESVHSLADTGNQALLLHGASRARRAANPDHPFGYGRERYFWSFVVALVLFSMGSLFAIYEGVEKLRQPHRLVSPAWAIGVLLVAIGLEAWSFRTASVEARAVRGEASLWGFIRRAKSPELPVVLLEDIGALFGLVFALTGVGLAMWTGDSRFDAMGSIAIGILLGAIALLLGHEMKSLLIGEAAAPDVEQRVRRAIERGAEVERLIHLRTLHLGPDDLLVAAKVAFARELDLPGVADAIDALEARVRADVAEARLIYIEPDVFRPA